MRKILLAGISFFFSFAAMAQSRIDIAHYSFFQQYYNPALTGNQGSVVKAFYRNQWTGFEDAPITMFASGEVALPDLGSSRVGAKSRSSSGHGHAMGLSVLKDSFGHYSETQVFLSYGSAIRLSQTLNLRWGSALSYKTNVLDGTRLNTADKSDPRYQNLLDQNNRKSRLDLNLGLALTSDNYYLAYALQDIAKDGFYRSGDEFLKESYSRKHIIQAGYRTGISGHFGVVVNGLYVSNDLERATLEGQLKGVYRNMIWAGAGYRNDLAYSLTAGVRLKQLQLGYAYESPTGEAQGIPNSTNEIVLSYHFSAFPGARKANQVLIW